MEGMEMMGDDLLILDVILGVLWQYLIFHNSPAVSWINCSRLAYSSKAKVKAMLSYS
jgi:hypothetical protein